MEYTLSVLYESYGQCKRGGVLFIIVWKGHKFFAISQFRFRIHQLESRRKVTELNTAVSVPCWWC